jgi:methionyl-tRNA synthetase
LAKRLQVVCLSERILVTAALPYANGPLHLGHIRSTYLPADIFARFQRLAGNEVVYVCATDEHGTPIVAAAEKAGVGPAEFASRFHDKDEAEFRALGFSFDIFHRTSSPENAETTQHFFEALKRNGFVYTREVEAPFCASCARFLPDRFVVGTCPHCGAQGIYSDYCESCGKALHSGELKEPRCITCGTPPVNRKSLHYFLRLSAFSGRLASWLSENKALQPEVVNYVSNWITQGLTDWDISRDMDWGVRVPGEKSKVFYVWFDAPIGYVSSTKALFSRRGEPGGWEDYWKGGKARIYHFIGKDIVYHHYLFWPAMLMGVGEGFSLPCAIPTRGYLNLEGRKFSKSRNWFVSLEQFLSEFPPDYLRYYETAITGFDVQDADFVWKDFQQKINNELAANLGNFVHRTLVLAGKIGCGKVPAFGEMDSRDRGMLDLVKGKADRAAALLAAIELRKAQEEVLSLSAEFNKYLSDKEPWKEKDAAKAATCIYVCTRGVTALAVMLEPFLPATSHRLLDMLSVGRGSLAWDDACSELLKPGAPLPPASPLFEKVSDEKIARMEALLGAGAPA